MNYFLLCSGLFIWGGPRKLKRWGMGGAKVFNNPVSHYDFETKSVQ